MRRPSRAPRAGLGIGLTVIGFADLVLMSGDARLKTPFTSLGVAPEAHRVAATLASRSPACARSSAT
ncbi:hypothetical protein [Actinomadura sp. BRA 177]|uniref:hypothetical protein n=1 Tax=Actinomadura sp. BRA 177 TaxID=2745202 RepID=UPI001C3E6396|nr:hypothetical protein [Actinomadura sp. BRA 177]